MGALNAKTVICDRERKMRGRDGGGQGEGEKYLPEGGYRK